MRTNFTYHDEYAKDGRHQLGQINFTVVLFLCSLFSSEYMWQSHVTESLRDQLIA